MTSPRLELDLQRRTAELFAQGKFADASALLSQALSESESAELWNDWAAVQISLGQTQDGELALRRALVLEPSHETSANNLGAVLYLQERYADAIPFLQRALASGSAENRAEVEKMLTRSQSRALRAAELAPTPVSDPRGAPAPPANTHEPDYAAVRAGFVAMQQAAPGRCYDDWFESVFRERVPVPNVRIATSWAEDSPWGKRAHNALVQLECEYAIELLKELQAKQVPGDIAEFGIFQGWWIGYLWQATEQIGMARRVYGFDSFEGLSEPHPEHDASFWKKGQYACSLDQVSRNVQAAQRPRIKLVKGFFEKSLRGPEAQLAGSFCYVRIDCDIYEPALDCLRYLSNRLADGAILVFDDWPHVRGFGEQRAFEEWIPSVPHLDFEFLFYGSIGHFYTRVHHRKSAG
jgi:tetratricopeptide (TPR) repeat protein